MTPEEVKALVEQLLASSLKEHSTTLLKDVSDYVDNRTTLYEDRLNQVEGFVTQPAKNEEKSELPETESPLAKRIALLESELKQERELKSQQDAEKRTLKFQNILSDHINGHPGVQNSKLVQELLYNRLNNGYEEKDGAFLTKAGRTVDEEVKTFFTSDEGKVFLKPQQVTKTPGFTQPRDSKVVDKHSQAVTLAQALMGK
jgi:hypothetical protein